MSTILQCSNLSKKYGKKEALSDFSIRVGSGKIVGLMGPNGSGKTTLIKLIAGFLQPSSGEVLINGRKPGAETKSYVAYLPDHLFMPEWMKVRDITAFYDDFFEDFDLTHAERMLAELRIDDSVQVRTLSKGMKEKLELVLVMARRAELYLLDEPLAGVDPAARDYILRTIITNYDKRASVIISTHLIADVEKILDDVIFIRDGHLERYEPVDAMRQETGTSVDRLFREEFK